MHPTTGEIRRWNDRHAIAGEEPSCSDFELAYRNVEQLLEDLEVHPEYSPTAVAIARLLAAYPDKIDATEFENFKGDELRQLAKAAALYGRREVLEQCLDRGVSATIVLPAAVQGEQLSVVRWLVEDRGAPPEVSDWHLSWTTPEVRSYLVSRRI